MKHLGKLWISQGVFPLGKDFLCFKNKNKSIKIKKRFRQGNCFPSYTGFLFLRTKIHPDICFKFNFLNMIVNLSLTKKVMIVTSLITNGYIMQKALFLSCATFEYFCLLLTRTKTNLDDNISSKYMAIFRLIKLDCLHLLSAYKSFRSAS